MISEKRHSLAHLLGDAIIKLKPSALLTIGPAVENGFYYDVDLQGETLSLDDLSKLTEIMKTTITTWSTFTPTTLTTTEAEELFKNNKYKLELIADIAKNGEAITTYTSGEFTDLCKGGHVENMNQIEDGSWVLDRISGAYWRGNENNTMLTRVYGLAFDTKDELDTFLSNRELAKERDHRKLGKELGLFVFSDLVGSGLPLYTPKGSYLRNKIADFSRELNQECGYLEVNTPNMNKAELFKVSGHYDKYKEDMFEVHSHYSDDEFFLKPMNCPQHTQIFASEPRSYRDLPIKYADFAMLYRDERPGELSGLTRARAFAQDDGHAFCTEDQLEDEFILVLNAIKKALTTYGFKYHIRLSLHDPAEKEKYLGDASVWEKAEGLLRKLLEKLEIPFVEGIGEAAFYGPKMDIMAVDALGREWQISTIQVDFNQPVRFKLEYKGKDGQLKTPIMIHRALIGSLERFMALAIEHYGGAFPLWMSPTHAAIIPVGESHKEFAEGIQKQMRSAGMNVDLIVDDSLGKRIRQAKTEKTPYAIVIGDKEMESGKLTIELRTGDKKEMAADDFVQHVQNLINTRSREL